MTALSHQTTQAVRKTFSGAGRPRKAGPRHPCGKLIQSKKAEREAEVIDLCFASRTDRAAATSGGQSSSAA